MEKCSGPNVAAASASPAASAAVDIRGDGQALHAAGLEPAGRGHIEDGVEARDDRLSLEAEPEGLEQGARSRVRGVGAGADCRHLQRVEAVRDHRARNLPSVALTHARVSNAVQQFQFGRVTEIPERAEADERAIGRRVGEPQPEPIGGKQGAAPGDDFGGLFGGDQLVVEDEATHARLREDGVERRMILIRNRTQRQPRRAERRYFFRTRSTTTS